jgi:ABC-type amino acid transport substrate-binding protein
LLRDLGLHCTALQQPDRAGRRGGHGLTQEDMIMFRISLAIAFVAGSLSVTIAAEPASAAAVLERIKAAGKVTLGYREGAAPFSTKNDQGQPAGYTIDVCQVVADDLKAALGVSDLPIEWVSVPIENGLTPVQEGKIDLLCGAAETLSRRKEVSFSIPIFKGGTGVMVRADTPIQLRKVLNGEPTGPVWRGSPARLLDKKTFAVVKGTTSENLLKNTLSRLQITANIAEVESFQAGVAAVLERRADVLVGDRSILVEASQSSAQPEDLLVIDRTFSSEPAALPLDRDDEDFRLAVDQSLSKLYRSTRFQDIYRKWFGDPSEATIDFFRTVALPE